MIFYAIPMYWAGVTQGLMWKEFTAEGYLQYPLFLETVLQIVPMYVIRAIGGLIFWVGVLVGFWNLYKTMRSGTLIATEKTEAPTMPREFKAKGHDKTWHRLLEFNPDDPPAWRPWASTYAFVLAVSEWVENDPPKSATVAASEARDLATLHSEALDAAGIPPMSREKHPGHSFLTPFSEALMSCAAYMDAVV